MREYILMLAKDDSILIEKGKKKNTKYGIIDGNVEYGSIIEARGKKFVAVKPTFIDLLKKCRRAAQIVTPKDASQIVAITGLSQGWRCLDAGAGSGFLAIFIASIVGKKGRVVTYEKRKEFYDVAKHNIEKCGLRNIVIKNKDVRNFGERNLDLITFDMKDSVKLIGKAAKRLKYGGWLVIYSPHIEQQIEARNEMEKHGMNVYATIETIQRKWKSLYGYTHPEPSGILHTGFMTFGRKACE